MAMRRQRGFGYVYALGLVLMMGIYLAKVGDVWSTNARRAKEQTLLDVGDEIRRALEAYVANYSGVGPRYPKSLDELVLDPRSVTPKRYLRKPYLDPMTERDWVYLEAPGGGFMGIYSRAAGKPLKQAEFPEAYRSFADQPNYQTWVFAAWPQMRSLGR